MKFAHLLPIVALLTAPALAADNLIPPGAAHVKRSVEDVTEFDIALTPYKVDAFYRATLSKQGWKPGDTVSYGTTLVLDLHKGTKGVARVTITPKGNNLTHVTLSLSE
jgi:hypothetical protein